MKTGNTVYGITSCDCKVSHSYLSIIEDCHLADLLLISRIFVLDFNYEAAVNLFYDLVNSWK